MSTYTDNITGVGSTLPARSTADTDSVWRPSSSSLTTPSRDTDTALSSTVTANDAAASLADSDSCSDDEFTMYVASAGCHACHVVAAFNAALVFGGNVSTSHDTATALAFLLPAPSVAVSSRVTDPSEHDTSSALHGRDGITSDVFDEQPASSDDSDDGGDGDDCSCQQCTHSDGAASPPHDTFTTTTSRFVTAGDANTATFAGGTVSTVHSTVRVCRSSLPTASTAHTVRRCGPSATPDGVSELFDADTTVHACDAASLTFTPPLSTHRARITCGPDDSGPTRSVASLPVHDSDEPSSEYCSHASSPLQLNAKSANSDDDDSAGDATTPGDP